MGGSYFQNCGRQPDLVVDDDVVLGRHVIGDVVVDDETQESVEKRQIDFLVHFLVLGLEHHITLPLSCVPHILEIVDS